MNPRPGVRAGSFFCYAARMFGRWRCRSRGALQAPIGVGLLVGALLQAAAPLAAQGNEGSSPGARPFPVGLVDGSAGGGSTEVYDLRIPVAFTVIPADDRPWGLRLRLVVYAGVYDFRADGDPDLELKFKSLGATPGVEFVIPAGGRWVLKPFTEIGYGHDFDDDVGAGLWSVGMRTLATWDLRPASLSFGTELKYLSTFTSDLGIDDDFGEIELGVEVRRPMGFTIAGNGADLGLYYIRRNFIDAVFESESDQPLDIEATNELGFSFGTDPRTTVWFIKLPRIGLGYRWGSGVRGVRLNFGFPF